MRRSPNYINEDDIFSPGTDLIVSLLAILLIILFMGTKLYYDSIIDKAKLENRVEDVNERLKDAEENNEALRKKYQGIEGRLNDTTKQLIDAKRTSFPPNIIIENAGKYAFSSGDAKLPKEFKEFIKNELVDKIEENIKKFDISIIEVIGHTDGQAVGSDSSNLDEMLENVANDIIPIEKLRPNSNADLGLMRALAVVKELQKIQNNENRLKKLNPKQGFRAYSAAQLTLRNGELAKSNSIPDATRRRIEIRFTRSRGDQTYGGNGLQQ